MSCENMGRTRLWRDDALAENNTYYHWFIATDYDDQYLYYEEDMFDDEDPYYDEVWKICTEYPDYKVSSYGRIWSWITMRLLRPSLGKVGYYYVDLRDDTRDDAPRYREYIHRLVALTFVPNPDPKHYTLVRHLDDVRTHNHYTNLAWGTQSDNIQDAIRNGHMDFRKRIHAVNLETNEEYDFDSGKEAALRLGVSRSGITMAAQGKIKSIKGHRITFLDDR